MNASAVLDSLKWMAPELALVGAILLVIVADLVCRGGKGVVWFAALLGLGTAGTLAAILLAGNGAEQTVFMRAFAVDGFSSLLKAVFAGAAILVGFISIPAIRGWATGKGEYLTLLLSCTLGMFLMAGANDLLMMYLSLEFVSITSYILAGLLRKNRKSAEASLKYIIYGAAASGLMIYGMSFLYGMAGTLNVADLGAELAKANVPPALTLITSVLIMAGFGYKIAAAPFHMWCPDVYEGAPTPVTAFFSVGPKAAGFAMLIRFLAGAFPEGGGAFEWKLVIAFLSLLTMAVGNFGAVHQQNLKRLFAYSSIAHAGYMLVAFLAFTPSSRAAILAYIVVYVIMNLGAFLVVIVLEQRYGIETVDGCRGIGWRSPKLGVSMTVFLVALTGLPPTAGFTAKLLLFGSVVEHGLAGGGGHDRPLGIAMVVIAVIFSVVSLYYYARIAAAMYLAKPRESDPSAETPAGVLNAVVLFLLVAGTLAFGLAWGPLEALTRGAAASFLVQ